MHFYHLSDYKGDGGLALDARLQNIRGLAFKGSELYITSMEHIRRVDAAGIITTVLGQPQQGSSAEGVSAANYFLTQGSGRVVFDPEGNMIFIDSNRVRMLKASTNTVETVANVLGVASCNSDDGTAAKAACLNTPLNLALSADGRTLFIAEFGTYRVRTVDLSTGILGIYAGNGVGYLTNGDGGDARSAGLSSVHDVALDTAGGLAIATNEHIRRVNSTRIISTIAGGGSVSQDTSGYAVNAQLEGATHVAPAGDMDFVYVGGTKGAVYRLTCMA